MATAFPGKVTTPPGWSRRKQRLEQEEKTESARQKAMKAELEWVRSNPKGRHAKSKARLARFDELSSQEVAEAQRDQGALYTAGPAPG